MATERLIVAVINLANDANTHQRTRPILSCRQYAYSSTPMIAHLIAAALALAMVQNKHIKWCADDWALVISDVPIALYRHEEDCWNEVFHLWAFGHNAKCVSQDRPHQVKHCVRSW